MKWKPIARASLPLLGAAVVFSLLLGWLYGHDNKYTHPGSQAISGLLVLDAPTLEREQVFYLTQGWQFYPGVLLSPGDFSNGKAPQTYMQTITIGKEGRFGLKGSAGSSASYHMVIALPEKEQSYTLVLPEIYSAYRLYINGGQALSVGVPENVGFTEQVARRSVTFCASGQAELLLAVSNRSHFYDGMTYPPLFGLPEAVAQQESLRLLLGSLPLAFALACALLSLYLIAAFHGRRERRLIVFLLASLCMAVTFLYPVLFQYAAVAPKPWYSIELFGIYGSYLFAAMVQNDLASPHPLCRKLSAWFLAAFTGTAVLYALLPGYPVWLVRLFGTGATGTKLFTAAYLLYCSMRICLLGRPNSRLLLFCTTAFGISVLWDRLCPNWEPILGGWPLAYGCLLLLLGIGFVLWRDLSEGYRFKLAFDQEKRFLTRQVAIQKAHYLALTSKIENTIRMRHDGRHHMQALHSLFAAGDFDRLGEYLEGLAQAAGPGAPTVLCRNLIIDSMLRYYQGLCQQDGIAFSASAALPPDLPIPDVDLSILFGNLLENAYEAARHPGCETPFVSCQAMLRHNALSLLVENSFSVPTQRRGERFLSTKRQGYGTGTQSARLVAEHSGGACTFEEQGGVFRAAALLYLPEKT